MDIDKNIVADKEVEAKEVKEVKEVAEKAPVEKVEKKVDYSEPKGYTNDRVEEELNKISSLRKELEIQVSENKIIKLRSEVNSSNLNNSAKEFLIKNFVKSDSTSDSIKAVMTEFEALIGGNDRKPQKGNFDFPIPSNSKVKTKEKFNIGSREYGKMLAGKK